MMTKSNRSGFTRQAVFTLCVITNRDWSTNRTSGTSTGPLYHTQRRILDPPRERLRPHRLGEGERDRVPFVRARHAAPAHVVLLLEHEPRVAVVAVARPAGVGLQRVAVGHLRAGGILEPLLRLHPHLGTAVERAAARPAGLVERRRLERRRAEVHRCDDPAVGLAPFADAVVHAGADAAD